MADINVTEKNGGFAVTVAEGGSSKSYSVTLKDDLYRKLTNGKISKSDCIKSAFKFLLDREPKESILSSFDVSIISRYFPEFESKFSSYT